MYSTGEGARFVSSMMMMSVEFEKKNEWLDEVFGIKMHLVYSEGVFVFKADCSNVDDEWKKYALFSVRVLG